MGADPVVYYSTVTGLSYTAENEETHQPLIADLTNSSIWSTSRPSDSSTITAVAVDLPSGISADDQRVMS